MMLLNDDEVHALYDNWCTEETYSNLHESQTVIMSTNPCCITHLFKTWVCDLLITLQVLNTSQKWNITQNFLEAADKSCIYTIQIQLQGKCMVPSIVTFIRTSLFIIALSCIFGPGHSEPLASRSEGPSWCQIEINIRLGAVHFCVWLRADPPTHLLKRTKSEINTDTTTPDCTKNTCSINTILYT